ncbi:cytosolic coat protein, putative [Trypanosoma brucei gambiense DAL972]|uniref:Cytosolic coat protein, putative n=1 Tax=Trypanosoma brucei gambiense (strain MHOM/CI/86/DAL972) TaxID=679716 RepID=D0AA90_TRYB9|nr:cytosolic coat protein, putative [Trypanosoma brucei gambiense DAL972]CBH18591.1 cytosolic coat protein, putative [Trypanosoma brucei gambiense DAL972]|eukprot:XP_011780855.1 cytosolic coat protein, putative [Trypanosoma brucei gambiense DAL972]
MTMRAMPLRVSGTIARLSLPLGLLLVTLPTFITTVRADDDAISVQVPPKKELCFFEDINKAGVKVFLHYLVTSGGSQDIEATIKNPDNSMIWSSGRDTEGRVLFKSRGSGRHRFCFSNKMSTISAKVVAFSITVGDEGLEGEDGKKGKKSDLGMDPIELAVRNIQHGLREVLEVQQYIRGREHKHRAVTEVANTRVFVWAMAEILIIIAMSLGNVWYLRRIFNKRRVV